MWRISDGSEGIVMSCTVDMRVVQCVDEVLFFFFQAEDGIRDYKVTGVQTCALPICEEHLHLRARRVLRLVEDDERAVERAPAHVSERHDLDHLALEVLLDGLEAEEIGRASCRERV